MNKILTTAIAAICVTASFAAEEERPALVDVTPESGRLSVRFGYFEPLGGADEFELDGVAAEGELILRPHNNIAIGFRGTIGAADQEYDYYDAKSRYGWSIGRGDLTYTDCNMAAQVYFSLYRNENFDIFLTAGAYYDGCEYEMEYYTHGHSHGYTYSDDCSTVGFLAGAGLELKNEYIGIKGGAEYLSKPDFDEVTKIEDEKALLHAYGTLMVFIGDRVSLDLAARYFTEWKDLYMMGGLTVIF